MRLNGGTLEVTTVEMLEAVHTVVGTWTLDHCVGVLCEYKPDNPDLMDPRAAYLLVARIFYSAMRVSMADRGFLPAWSYQIAEEISASGFKTLRRWSDDIPGVYEDGALTDPEYGYLLREFDA